MEIGQPDFPAPPLVADAAVEAIRTRRLGYTDSTGLPPLRQAISDYYRERLGIAVPPSRIIVTAGASGAFLLTLGSLVDPGDEVLMPDPCYPCNRHFVRLFEGRPRAIPVDEASRYQPTAADVRSSWTRATRACSSRRRQSDRHLDTARRAALDHRLGAVLGGFTVVDEIRSSTRRASAALELADDVRGLQLLKYFCRRAGGWRITRPVPRPRDREAQQNDSSASAPAQYARARGVPPRPSPCSSSAEEFRRRHDYMVPALRRLLGSPVPEGAFYIYAGCEILRGQHAVRAKGPGGSGRSDHAGTGFRIERSRAARTLRLHALAGGPRGRRREHRPGAGSRPGVESGRYTELRVPGRAKPRIACCSLPFSASTFCAYWLVVSASAPL